jgi:hypothetical protein
MLQNGCTFFFSGQMVGMFQLTALNKISARTIGRGPGRSVGIATGYGLDGPGIESGGFGGLVVSILASGTQDRGFAPDRSRRIFHAGKIHSMPSFGGEVK